MDVIDEEDLPLTQQVDDRILKDVTAYVEVRSAHDNRSDSVRHELEQLGARVVKKFTDEVTHVVFKEGCNRTKTKALKKGVHFVSVLWVDRCKQRKEHVSERMFPAFVPESKGTPLLFSKMKKAKSMQPRDFEEELANSAERVRRKRKKLEALHQARYSNSTPPYSPRAHGAILVQETQPRASLDDGEFVFTPVRLAIPDTPPGMREKMRELKLLKDDAEDTASDMEAEAKQEGLRFLQKKLFEGQSVTSDAESVITEEREELDRSASEVSVNNDILNIVSKINQSLSHPNKSKRKFYEDDSEDLSLNCSQDSVDLLNNKKVNENLNKQKGNLIHLGKKSAVNDTSESKSVQEHVKEKSSAENGKNFNEKGKRKSRRSSRLSIQSGKASLNGSKTDENVSECHTPTDKDTVENKTEKSAEYIDRNQNDDLNHQLNIGTQSDELNLQLSLSPIRETENQNDKNDDKIMKPAISETVCESNRNNNNSNQHEHCEKENKPSKQTRRRSTINSKKKSTAAKESSETTSDEIHPQNGEQQTIDKPDNNTENHTKKSTKENKATKKKLMSLSDMIDQHSVLIEPAKSSTQNNRQVLMDTPKETEVKKRGRKSISNQQNDKHSDKENSTGNDKQTKTKKRRSKDSKMDEQKDDKKENDQSRKKPSDEKTRRSRAKKSKTILANDTHIDNPDGTGDKRPLTDVTTRLNLTKDKSLTCSIRETTLSMSMSRAYPDGDMSSILASARRSIDEFSQKNVGKRKSRKAHRSGFTSIREVEVSTSSSDSDRSLKRKKKNPSLVMTSLHSMEVEVSTSSSDSDRSLKRKKKNPSLVMTSLHSIDQDLVIQVVKKLGGFVITDNVNDTTTHVICGEARRTLNMLQCLARGLWMLSKEWVIKSLEAGEWVSEENFECVDFFPACKEARLEREQCISYYRQTLFTSTGLIYISGRSSPPRPNLVQLVKHCGGQVTASLDKADVYVGADFHPGITCVQPTWLLDCIKLHETLPLDNYTLDRPKRESSPVY